MFGAGSVAWSAQIGASQVPVRRDGTFQSHRNGAGLPQSQRRRRPGEQTITAPPPGMGTRSHGIGTPPDEIVQHLVRQVQHAPIGANMFVPWRGFEPENAPDVAGTNLPARNGHDTIPAVELAELKNDVAGPNLIDPGARPEEEDARYSIQFRLGDGRAKAVRYFDRPDLVVMPE
ncbi:MULTISPECIES: hypothetical protein [unclassified Sphingobium]|uniref:hypothetical protein n=1 Tax=unclassified Sphingobium TaxID=2611147 RepID=UPI0035A70A40